MDRPGQAREGYSTRDVAALLGLPVAQVRAFARAGFVSPAVGPQGELLFSFQDLVLLRTAKALAAARIPLRRIRIALRNLQEQLPQGQPLTGVRISALGHHVVARDAGEAWHPESGQTLLDFDVAELEREAAALGPHRVPPAAPGPADRGEPAPAEGRTGGEAPGRAGGTPAAGTAGAEPVTAGAGGPRRATDDTGGPRAATAAAAGREGAGMREERSGAADWYERGVELEEEAPLEAIEAYRQALAIEDRLADAHLNLGRLLHERGDVRAAERHYRRALAARPGDAVAAYNLGVALQDLGKLAEAAAAYEAALASDESLADAHFNLSGVYEELGEAAEAFRHLKSFRSLTAGKP